jgi:hypothetical protein
MKKKLKLNLSDQAQLNGPPTLISPLITVTHRISKSGPRAVVKTTQGKHTNPK